MMEEKLKDKHSSPLILALLKKNHIYNACESVGFFENLNFKKTIRRLS